MTNAAKHGFTIHPAIINSKNQWHFFYHDGAYPLDGTPGSDCRRQVCADNEEIQTKLNIPICSHANFNKNK
ncbi:MAG: hypothetical protein PHG27_07810 [Massilibacteroides sp.]|nr:hypothetical protein [Massilibacteroides sp.]